MSPRAQLRRHVATIRGAVPTDPDTLTPALEAELLAVLRPWIDRVAAARRAYEAGELDSPPGPGRGRMAAYNATPMAEAERHAAFRLYRAVVALVGGIALQYHEVIPHHAYDVEDLLSDCYEFTLVALSGYGHSRGEKRDENASLAQWIAYEVGSLIRAQLTAMSRSRTDAQGLPPIPFGAEEGEIDPESVAGPDPDAQEPDLAGLARHLVRADGDLDGLVDRLFPGD